MCHFSGKKRNVINMFVCVHLYANKKSIIPCPKSYIINDVNYVYATMDVSNDLASNKRYFITTIMINVFALTFRKFVLNLYLFKVSAQIPPKSFIF